MDTQQKAATRFAEKIDKVPNGCWRWLGVLSVHGYAMHYVGSRVVLGHIFAYETYIGSRKPKRDGHVGHTCGDRACVNPAHLIWKTRRPLAERFWEKVEKTEGCWNWTAGTGHYGYGRINLGGREGPKLVHQVSWFLHTGQWANAVGVHLCHTCDNPKCVNPAHLYVGNAASNSRDREARRRGNQPCNENNGKCKWPSEVVQEIRKLRGVMPGATVAARYGMPLSTVYGYWHGSRRKHC